MLSASVSDIICTYVHNLSCILRANVMIGCDMIVRAVQSLPGCWSSQSTLCTFLSQELPFEGSSQSFCTCRVMKNFLQQLKIVPTLEFLGDVYTETDAGFWSSNSFLLEGKGALIPTHLVHHYHSRERGQKPHQPIKLRWLWKWLHALNPVYIGTAIKQFQYRTTGYLVLTQPHIFKLSTVQQQSQ